MRRTITIALAATLTVAVPAACNDDAGDDSGRRELESDLARDTRPAVPYADLDRLIAGEAELAADLYHYLAGTQDGNLWFSPVSIELALSMAAAGARGTTLEEMRTVMHQDGLHTDVNAAVNALDLELARRRNLPEDVEGDPLRIDVANSLWSQDGLAVKRAFLDTLARDYGTGLFLADFERTPDAERKRINEWVAESTQDEITDLIPSGAIDDSTRLVLANAIYFKASWETPFDPDSTQDLPFTTAAGSTVTVPMVSGGAEYAYARGDGWQAVRLPYLGNASMELIVPDAGKLADVEANLAGVLVTASDQLALRPVTLTMPKLDLRSRFSLRDALVALGMPAAFGPDADFSGLTAEEQLTIGAVLHEATLALDEQGSEAAAATAVLMETTATPDEEAPVTLTVDRPYVLLIRDSNSAVLFLGRVVDPS